jgi:DNA repair protein RadA/Sms
VGLAGEIRRVAGVQRRLAEAERMGFRRAIVPAGSVPESSAWPSGGRPPRKLRAVPAADSRLEVTAVTDLRAAMVAALGAR